MPILAAEPVPVKAPMREANVVLTTQPAPKIKIRELSLSPARRGKAKVPREDRTVAASDKTQPESHPSTSAASAKRNDSPY